MYLIQRYHFLFGVTNNLLSVFNKVVKTNKKKVTTKKKNIKKIKSIENTISPGDPCTNVFYTHDCVLDNDKKKAKQITKTEFSFNFESHCIKL